MAFPQTHLTILVELALGADLTADPGTWSWTDATDYVRLGNAGRIQITRGRADQSALADTSKLSMTVDNSDGRWATRNPLGAWFGQIRKGTPIRVSAEGNVRYTGFLSALPPRWDLSENDRWVDVEAQGLLYRLTQAQSPVRSALTSALLSFHSDVATPATLAGYWPMEPGSSSASRFSSALPSGQPMTVSGEAPDVGDNGIGPLLGSDRIPVLAATTSISGSVPTYSTVGTGLFAVLCIMDVPLSTGWSDNTPILRVHQSTSGSTVATWEIRYKTGAGGDLEVRALDESGSQLDTTGTVNTNIDGRQFLFIFDTATLLGGTTLNLRFFYLDDNGVVQSDTFNDFFSLTPTIAKRVEIAPSGGLTELAIGQVAVDRTASIFSSPIVTTLAPTAFSGEQAHDRFERLGEGQDPGVRVTTAGTISQLMGPQDIGTFVELARDCEASDQAYLYEGLDFDLVLQTLDERYNQDVSLTLDYATSGHVAPPLEPTDDDRYAINDVTVERDGGASTRVSEESTSVELSIPNIGRRDEQVTLSLHTDDQTEQIASWRLHVGTTPGYRYPSVTLDLAAGPGLITDWCATPLGGRITIDNPPMDLRAEDVDLIVEGYTETLNFYGWNVDINGSLTAPYQIGEVEHDTLAIIGSEDATTTEALDTTETGVDINCGAGADWVYEVDFDIVIGGERMTVTAVGSATGTFPNRAQTLTVTRSVNGVTKSHSTGAAVALAQYAYIGL